MTGVRLEVQWSPIHPDMFITWGTEIFLYETLPRKEILKSTHVAISDTSVAHLLATNSNHHYVKCVDIYPQPEPDILLAIGQANGKVVLTTFGPTAFDSIGLTGLELAPKHARQCNTLAWNPIDSNLIAAGLDKYRTDHSVLLWDVLKCPVTRSHGASTPSEYARPVAELGLSDTAHSLAWLSSQPQSLVIGMNNKHLKMIDLRDPSKAANSAPTKAVYGIAVAPYSDHQLASFFENQIAIWDTRSFEKPVLTLPQVKPVSKILWCPTRHNLLGSVQRDSAVIHLHDVQQSMDDAEPSVLERSVQPGSANQITSFSWHPTHENRLLTIALSGTLTDYVVFERMTLNWSSSSHIVWTFGRRTLKMISDKDSAYSMINDISSKMKQRALNGYGLKGELWQNSELVDDDALKTLWQWLYLSRNLVEDGHIDVNGLTKHPGVRSVLGMDVGTSLGNKSDLVCLPWADFATSQSTVRVYRSDDRDVALQLCGWRFEKDASALNTFLDRLEAECEYPRAAAIAVFNLRLRTAIEILNRGAVIENKQNSLSNLNIVAMALSGYSDSKNSMWRELCLNAKAQISHPYLRATFGFLTAEGDNYDAVLNETGISVQDRVAFACIYLSNSKLFEYLSQLSDTLIQEGDLAGMLLTGACSEGIPLLQRYLDVTGDVQSVSVISIRAFPSVLLDKDPILQEWINSYRVLLDGWRLWTQRAHVDISLNSHNSNAKPVQQVFVSCNFCGKSISVYMQGGARSRGQIARLGTTANKLKMSSCPNCRKPQPRCAICLVNMGTPSCYQGVTPPSGSPTRPSTIKLTEFASWFTWCQTCRHGGHSSHMTQWFREHSECPVTACTCRCLSLDAASKITSLAPLKTKTNILSL